MIVDAVDQYIASIRAGGGLYREDARCLAHYAAFAQARGECHVRIQTFLEWARGYASAQYRRTLLLIVRRFALAVTLEDPRHEVPAADLLPGVPQVRRRPYIYSSGEIASLLAVADECSSIACPVPGQYRILFGLIAATGIRRCEALALDIGDITSEGMMVRPTKRAGRRLLPLHPTVETELMRHLRRRVRAPVDTEALFLGDRHRRLAQSTTVGVFHRMLARTGLTGAASGGRNPRIHDFRHTFAVRSLEACGSDRSAIDRHIVALSAWLGHASLVDTYWYIESTETLLRRIARQTESFRGEGTS